MLDLFRFPKDSREFSWTAHSKNKMLQYRLGEQKIRSVLNAPTRIESGIAPKTTAVMKRSDTPKRKEEIWVMYQERATGSYATSDNLKESGSEMKKFENFLARKIKKKTIISVWRYPGVSTKRNIFIPDDTLEELEKLT